VKRNVLRAFSFLLATSNQNQTEVMEKIINIHIERLPEGMYLATSEDVQGLIAQGRTVAETIEIARDVAKKLLESQQNMESTKDVEDNFDYPLVVGA